MTKTDQLTSSIYFSSPIYSIEVPEWVNYTNKICDKYLFSSSIRVGFPLL